jgi:hypothetical protein
MHYKDLAITGSPNLATVQHRTAFIDGARILGGACALGFIAVGVIRVINSWRKAFV